MDRNNDNHASASVDDTQSFWMQDDVVAAGTNDNDAETKAADTSANDTQIDTKPPIADRPEDDLDTYIAIILRDGLDRPIPGLPVKIEVPGAPPVETTTSEHGAVVVPKGDGKKQVTLQVRDETAQYQEVCKIDPAKCTTGVAIVRSPKVAEKVSLRPHHTKRSASSTQTSASTSASTPNPAAQGQQSNTKSQSKVEGQDRGWFQVARDWLNKVMHPHDYLQSTPQSDAQQKILAQAANKSGNPIAIITGPECPNNDNLCLGRNGIYRQIILDAAKRYSLSPQSIAALIDAEAAKITDTVPLTNPDGTPKIIKSGKNKGKPAVREIGKHWDAKSANPTGAAGLTQFIVDTWLRHTTKRGCYINEKCMSKNWVQETKDKHGKVKCVFVLADGRTTEEPWHHQSDSNVRSCLDQRFVAERSIMAAADYGVANLERLKDLGFKIKGLNDVEKAKLMYLMHHEGEPAGPLVIKNKLNDLPKGKYPSVEDRIRATFFMQVGKSKAEEHIKNANGNVAKAYRTWLAGYIDQKIDFTNFCCNADKFPEPLKTLELFEKVGGEK